MIRFAVRNDGALLQKVARSWMASRYVTMASMRALAASSDSPSRVRLKASPQTGISRSPCELTVRPSMMARSRSFGNTPPLRTAYDVRLGGSRRNSLASDPRRGHRRHDRRRSRRETGSCPHRQAGST